MCQGVEVKFLAKKLKQWAKEAKKNCRAEGIQGIQLYLCVIVTGSEPFYISSAFNYFKYKSNLI